MFEFEIQLFFKNFFNLPKLVNKENWVRIFYEMAVHTRKLKPEKLLLARRPNEEDDILAYRLANYEPITYGSMNRALDDLYRIVNSINYKLNIPSQYTRDFINTRAFYGYDFEMFLQKLVLKRGIEDPNGFLCWLPDGKGIENPGEKITVKPCLVYSEQIHYLDENVFSYLSEEKSPVIVDKKTVWEGEVYHVLTDDSFYKVIQIGKKNERKFQTKIIYQHDIGEVPAIVLGGDMSAHRYFESYFAPYVAFGNEAIRQFSDWQAVMTTTMFPYTEDFVAECDMPEEKKVRKSSDPVPEGEETFKPRKMKIFNAKTPYNTRIRKVKSEQNKWDDVLDPSIPGRRYIHPDVNVAKYSGEAWSEILIPQAERALHLNLGEGDLSGKAKMVERESKYSMVNKIGGNYFDNLMLNSLLYIDAYLNVHAIDRNEISIDKPVSFHIKTEADLIEEMGFLQTQQVPALFLAEATIDLAQKRFSGNKLSQKIFNVISVLDTLYIYTQPQKQAMFMAGYVSKSQVIKSTHIYSLLLSMANEEGNDNFIQMEIDVISKNLDEKLALFTSELETMPITDDNGNPKV